MGLKPAYVFFFFQLVHSSKGRYFAIYTNSHVHPKYSKRSQVDLMYWTRAGQKGNACANGQAMCLYKSSICKRVRKKSKKIKKLFLILSFIWHTLSESRSSKLTHKLTANHKALWWQIMEKGLICCDSVQHQKKKKTRKMIFQPQFTFFIKHLIWAWFVPKYMLGSN